MRVKKSWLYPLALSMLVWLGSTPTGTGLAHGNPHAAEPNAVDDHAADVNEDGFIDLIDLDLVAANFGPSAAATDPTPGDVNEDQVVDIFDLALVARNFGRIVPKPFRAMRIERAFPNLDFKALTNLVQPDDGRDRLFVTEKAGLIRVFPNHDEVAEASVFLDIRDRVSEAGTEEGLLGLAFDPNFVSTGYFYMYYSAAQPRRSIVSRFSVSERTPNMADPESELVIMEVMQPFNNHNGGQLAFGPDKYLYIGVGDGGSGGDPLGNGQDTSTLLGSVLRIDVSGVFDGRNYRAPADNPFVGIPDARDEIWAYGLRNPWRFSFQTLGERSGTLWAGRRRTKSLGGT